MKSEAVNLKNPGCFVSLYSAPKFLGPQNITALSCAKNLQQFFSNLDLHNGYIFSDIREFCSSVGQVLRVFAVFNLVETML